MSGGKLGELQTRAARLVAAPGIDRGTMAVKVRELITAAYELGRAEHGHELADVLRALIDNESLRAPFAPEILAALSPLIPPPLALSDDDSEVQADAAQQRAQFREVHFPGSGPVQVPWPETGEPFRGAAEREWDDSRGSEP